MNKEKLLKENRKSPYRHERRFEKEHYSDYENKSISEVWKEAGESWREVGYTINKATKDISSACNQFNEEIGNIGMGYENNNTSHSSNYVSKNPRGNISSLLYLLYGANGIIYPFIYFFYKEIGLFTDDNYISNILNEILDTNYSWNIDININAENMILLLIVGIALISRGIYLRKRISRFKKYIRIIGTNHNYIRIKDLAAMANRSEEFILKDLNKMIKLNMFLQGHIDKKEIYFMMNDEVYKEYLGLSNKDEFKENLSYHEKVDINNSDEYELKYKLNKSRIYINDIEEIKVELCDEKIFINLDRLVKISKTIINQVEKNPSKIYEINSFTNHYLPTTIKLINSYKEITNQPVQCENIQNTKLEIEKSIELINDAFENLLDDLFEDVALDVSTDISVLKTLFKQEGLGEDDFN